MKTAITLLALVSAAFASAQSSRSMARPLSVAEAIERQQTLVGTRVVLRGQISSCYRLSCALHGMDRDGHRRFLSIGRDAAFDAVVSRHLGRTVEIEAVLTDECLPDADPNLIVMCTDRPATLVHPKFIRAF